jgi:3',5'-cyclic AMP phosphodiesterase CpdA
MNSHLKKAAVPTQSDGHLLFGVLSDLHLLDPALGLPEGAARSALLRTALAHFRDRGVDGVLVCGDLTNNGFVTELEEVARVWFEVFPEGRLPDGRRVLEPGDFVLSASLRSEARFAL